jgi:hypothetical protein
VSITSPFVDLNGSVTGGLDRTVTWTNAGNVVIADAAAALVTDTGTIASLTATIPVAQAGDLMSATASRHHGQLQCCRPGTQAVGRGHGVPARPCCRDQIQQHGRRCGLAPSSSSWPTTAQWWPWAPSRSWCRGSISTVAVRQQLHHDLEQPGTVNIADPRGVVFDSQAANWFR